MQTPHVVPSQDERELNESERAGLDCLKETRHKVVGDFGALLESERITRSDNFGYIFRYEGYSVLKDEDGTSHKLRFHLILWSEDCTKLFLAAF